MNIFCLQICVDKDPDSEDALFVTFDVTQAETWKTAAKKFRTLHPEVMQRFGNGRISIVQRNSMLPEIHRCN